MNRKVTRLPIISESRLKYRLNRILKEEVEKIMTDKDYVGFIRLLHGYLIRLKEIHWHTDRNGVHVLCDEIMDELAELEDSFAESAMGVDGGHFGMGGLKPIYPSSTELGKLMKELEKDAVSEKASLGGKNENGLSAIVDDIIEMADKYRYRATQVERG